ncbi:unnamed protein product [Echinostoma caproni]|uniref:PDZ domain-containing protein n=1 Tax=Echinostoma caproni TaxID=27848 RepID=A0A183AFK2_9TREM|nr:unnamed protein product [Echinostoma caproni]
MYCTLNTHKLDVDKVLGREIGLNDFLFAHVKSQPKEIRIRKDCEAFGMTLTDTGCGVVFIKRILPGGMMAYASEACGGMIEIGDQIEKINNISFIGRRHYEVAAYLRSIPIGATFLLRLVSPERSPIYMLNSRATLNASSVGLGGKKRTIRLRTNGTVEERVKEALSTPLLHTSSEVLLTGKLLLPVTFDGVDNQGKPRGAQAANIVSLSFVWPLHIDMIESAAVRSHGGTQAITPHQGTVSS